MITTDVSFVDAAQLFATHLADHQLPPPASLAVLTQGAGPSELRVQLPSSTAAELAADLLVWADTLTTLTATVWRSPRGDRVHLSLTSTLTSPMDTVELEVFGGATYCPTLFSDLEPDDRRATTLASLRTWASSTSTHTTTPLLDLHWGKR